MSIIQLAIIFFIMSNPVGNIPAILSLIKHHQLRDQQKILLRESIFSMLLALFFLFVGEAFLTHLQIRNYALTTSGGILLLIIALNMIFSHPEEENQKKPKQDPFIVPIATPILSGAGLLTMIILYSQQGESIFNLVIAILLAWTAITAVLLTAPYLQVLLGRRGLNALEQLMGMLLAMIAIELIVKGAALLRAAMNS